MSHVATGAHVTRQRRGTGWALALAAALLVAVIVYPLLSGGVHRHGLPLSDASIIREQAAAKHLDPALIAGGDLRREQIRTAAVFGRGGGADADPARKRPITWRKLSGGRRFTAADLATPAINVAYGSYYLRYLLNHYDGNEMLAIAAYNGGLTNVDRWVAKAREAEGGSLTVGAIPFPETREYVQRVLAAQREYRATYPRELGIS